MHRPDRRTFLLSAGATAAAISLLSSAAGKDEPSDRIRLCVVGVRGRGRGVGPNFARLSQCQVTHVCDVNEPLMAPFAKQIADIQKNDAEVRAGPARRARTTSRSTPSSSPRRTTGTPWPPSGAARPASTSTSRSPCRTTSSRATRRSRRRASTRRWCRPAPRAAACRTTSRRSSTSAPASSARSTWPRRGTASSAAAWTAAKDSAGAQGAGLEHLAGAGPGAAVQRPTATPTAGGGCGTTAPATWATTASTTSTSPAGAWASTTPSAVNCTGGKLFFDGDIQETPDTQIVTFTFPETQGGPGLRAAAVVAVPPGGARERRGVLRHRGLHDRSAGGAGRWSSKRQQGGLRQEGDVLATSRTWRTSCRASRAASGRPATSRTGTARRCWRTWATSRYRVGRPLKFDGKTETIVGDEKANALLKRPGRKGFEIPEKV